MANTIALSRRSLIGGGLSCVAIGAASAMGASALFGQPSASSLGPDAVMDLTKDTSAVKNTRIGYVSRLLSPGMGFCEKCNTTWNFVSCHITNVTKSRGLFALCEACWLETSPQDRVGYYRKLWEKQGPDQDYTWDQVEQAVLAEKAKAPAGTPFGHMPMQDEISHFSDPEPFIQI